MLSPLTRALKREREHLKLGAIDKWCECFLYWKVFQERAREKDKNC